MIQFLALSAYCWAANLLFVPGFGVLMAVLELFINSASAGTGWLRQRCTLVSFEVMLRLVLKSSTKVEVL